MQHKTNDISQIVNNFRLNKQIYLYNHLWISLCKNIESLKSRKSKDNSCLVYSAKNTLYIANRARNEFKAFAISLQRLVVFSKYFCVFSLLCESKKYEK